MRVILVGGVAILALALADCGSTAPQGGGINGTWQGTFAPTVDCEVIGVYLSQSDTVLAGGWSETGCNGNTTEARGSNLSGTFVNGTATFRFDGGFAFAGTLSGDGNTLTGYLNQIQFSMTRQ